MAGPSSTQQFGRVASVVVGQASAGQGIAVESLRIRFEVVKTLRHTPNTAMIEIFNLNPTHENQVRNEFDEVLLNAGYKGAERLVFTGNIRHAFRRREGNDWITRIDAADGDDDYRNTIVNAVFKAAATDGQVVDHLIGKMKSTKKGQIKIQNQARARGRVFSGMARDVFHQIASKYDAHWSIQDGVLQIVPVDATLDGEAIKLRSDTGLLSAPEINDKGIKVKCQLNPAIRIQGKLQLDNNDFKEQIRQARFSAPGAKKPSKTKTRSIARLDPDGIYRVTALRHVGDTRGAEWYTEALVTALGLPIAPGRIVTS